MAERSSEETRDLNGVGDWSEAAILRRYEAHCRAVGVEGTIVGGKRLRHTDVVWIYPVLDEIVDGIEAGCPACRRIGVELVETDQFMPFGRILKSNTARALRRSALDEDEKERLRRRIVGMLLIGMVPHEFKQYARLLKTIGFEAYRDIVVTQSEPANRFVMRWVRMLTDDSWKGLRS